MSLRRAAFASGVWSLLLFWSRFGINSIIFVVAAKWMTAADLGHFAFAFALVQLFQAIQSSSIPDAVIRDQNRTEGYVNTAFWISVILGCTFAVIQLAAGLFLLFTERENATAYYMLVLSVVPLVVGIGAVPEAIIRTRLNVRLLAIRTAVAFTIAGGGALWIMSRGGGGWALVAFALVSSVFVSTTNFTFSGISPTFRISKRLLRRILVDGANLGGGTIVKGLTIPVSQIAITVVLGAESGGIFYIAQRFSGIVYSVANMPAQFVSLPLLSRTSRHPEHRGAAIIEGSTIISVLTAPIYLGLFAIADDLIPFIVQGSFSADAVIATRGFLINSPVVVIVGLGMSAVIAANLFTLNFFMTVAQVSIALLAAAFAVVHSAAVVSWALSLSSFLIVPIWARVLERNTQVSSKSLLFSTLRPWLASSLMAVIVIVSGQISKPFFYNDMSGAVSRLLLLCLIGAVAYVPMLYIVAKVELQMTLSFIRNGLTR